MTAAPTSDSKLGPLLENPVPVHFVGGLVCGLTLMTRMASEVLVNSEDLKGRQHVYRRTGRALRAAEIVMHCEIRDTGYRSRER